MTDFPPQRMTPTEVSGGLVLPYVAQAVAGKAGAVSMLLTIFMVSVFPEVRKGLI